MVSHERTQRITFRAADIACSVIAFTAAYKILLPARSLLLQMVPASLAESGVREALAGKDIPGIPELSWIFVVAALAMGLTVEYGNDSRLLSIRSYGNIISLQLAATSIAAVVIGTIVYAFSVPLYSRLFVASHLAWLFVLTAGYRVILKSIAMHYHAARDARRRILIAGRPDGISAFLSMMAGQKTDIAYEIRGCLIDDKAETSSPLNIPVLGDVNSLGDLLIHDPIDEVIVVLPNGDSPWLATAPERDVFQRERIAKSLDSLDDATREIIRLKHFEDRTFEEIALLQCCSPNTIKTRYYRGLVRLRTQLRASDCTDS